MYAFLRIYIYKKIIILQLYDATAKDFSNASSERAKLATQVNDCFRNVLKAEVKINILLQCGLDTESPDRGALGNC